MVSTTISRSSAAAGALGLCGASIFGATAAVASPDSCAYAGSTEVVPGVCQVVITADGVYTFPSTLGKVSAVVVGAGGGGYQDFNGNGPYGGGGGEVIYVDTVTLDTALTVDVGQGGAAGSDATIATDGGDTLLGAITARGGHAPVPETPGDPGHSNYSGGLSGNGNTGFGGGSLAGGGAAGSAPSTETGGPGYLLSTVPGVDGALFPSSADAGIHFGEGGIGNYQDNLISLPATIPNSGAGGAAFVNWDENTDEFGDSAPGEDGIVVVRYAAAALASTGIDSTSAILAGGLLTASGAAIVVAVATSRRRRNTI